MGLVISQHVESSWTRDQTLVPCIGKWILIYTSNCSVMSNSSKPHGLQDSLSFTVPQNLLKFMSTESVILPSHPLRPPCPLVFSISQHWDLFRWVGSSNQVPIVLELQLQHQSFQWIFLSFRMDWFKSLWSTKDSQESSLTPQFESISFLTLSFLYGPALTSIHDYWKTHSFDYTGLCQ